MLAEDMYGHRDDYLGDVAFLSKRLNIGIQDARILAIHFKGMGPEAIAMRFKMPLDTVRAAFDRIMFGVLVRLEHQAADAVAVVLV